MDVVSSSSSPNGPSRAPAGHRSLPETDAMDAPTSLPSMELRAAPGNLNLVASSLFRASRIRHDLIPASPAGAPRPSTVPPTSCAGEPATGKRGCIHCLASSCTTLAGFAPSMPPESPCQVSPLLHLHHLLERASGSATPSRRTRSPSPATTRPRALTTPGPRATARWGPAASPRPPSPTGPTPCCAYSR